MPKFDVHVTTARVVTIEAYDEVEAEYKAVELMGGENLCTVIDVEEVDDDARPSPRS